MRGCGVGDIKTMLETGNFGGKCADLNALFVGLSARSACPRATSTASASRRRRSATRRSARATRTSASAQHCRAEVFLKDYGWVADGPGRRRARWCARRRSDWLKIDHPLVAPVRPKLFGGWEGNWLAFNTAHDVALPDATRAEARLPHVPAGRDRAGPRATASTRTISSTRSRRARSLPERRRGGAGARRDRVAAPALVHAPPDRSRASVLGRVGAHGAVAAARADGARFVPWKDATPPALALRDLAGRRHALADYRGKVVLVNFWATWCEPCREEMPSMQRLKRAFRRAAVRHSRGELRGVGHPGRRLPEALPPRPDGAPRPSQDASRAWRVRVLPASFLVGADGRVRYSVIGEIDWMSSPAIETVRGLFP